MAEHYLAHLTGTAVADAQARYYGNVTFPVADVSREIDELGADERSFILRRDSFYMATITETGWPYLQHRGGPPGFLRVLGPRQLGFVDIRGNRQMVSTGNLAAQPRVSLFLMDYPRRERLKLLGTAEVLDAREHRQLADELSPDGWRVRAERVVLINVVSFDWNCPKNIAPRFSAEEVREVVAPLQQRIRELETQLAAARQSSTPSTPPSS